MQKSRFKSLLLISSLLSTVLIGCRDFSQVEKLGERGTKIEESAVAMTKDFYASCLRAAQFPASSRIFGEGPDFFDTVKSERERCDQKYPPAQESMLKAYQVYTKYFNQLLILASNNTGAITDKQKKELDDSLNSLVTNISATNLSVPSIVSDNIGNGSAILNAIVVFFGDEIRQKAIASAIVCTNDEIQDYTKALVGISSGVYVNQLRIERGNFEEHLTNFTPAIPTGTLTVQESQSLLEIQNIVVVKDQELREKEVKAQELSANLEATTRMHNELSLVFAKELGLTKEKGEIDEVKKKNFCQIYEAEAAENAQTKSYEEEKLEISPAGRKEIYKIIKKYNNSIE